MRILYFHQHFSTPNGAAGIRSYQMAQRLIHKGHKVTMICGSYNGGETGLVSAFVNGRRNGSVEGIDVIEFNLAYSNNDGLIKRAVLFLKFALRSIILVFSESYDVVFATTTPLTAGIPGIFSRWLRRKPFVFEVRDLWPELPKQMGVIKNPLVLFLLYALEWASYRSANRCIGLSPGIVEGIKCRGVLENKITLVPNGCDLDIFGGKLDAWRPEGVTDSDLMAVFAGTHGIANGLDAALDAAKELKARGRLDIKIVLIGQGKLKQSLQERAKKEQLNNVIFHAPVNKAKLAGLMASTDVGLQLLANIPAFYYGTSPNKFFDYIAAGIPVLNNYPGWLAEIIAENDCGFYANPEHTDSFADALESAAEDKLKLKQMGLNARQLAEKKFNRKTLSDQWVNWVTGVHQ